jgi:diacylglycerol diphosphate phosphatase/phosphatidate phosphatase
MLDNKTEELTNKAQLQFFAEPFHRMFYLDNLAISYPHASAERVNVST